MAGPNGIDLCQGPGDVTVALEVCAEWRPAEVLRAAVGAFEARPEPDDQNHAEDEGKNRVHGLKFAPTDICHEWQNGRWSSFSCQLCDTASMALKTVAVLMPEQAAVFEFGVLCEVFGIDRTSQGVPSFDFRVCAEDPTQPVCLTNGLTLTVPHGLDGLEGADLVAVPATTLREFSPALLDALRRAHAAGATMLSVCSGVFVLAAADLLDERECATHWMNTEELAAAHPRARVNRDVLFIDDGDVITSAGTAAGIDACLHLVRRELGAAVATKIARRMVVPPQRDGGQRQFVDLPIPECSSDSLEPVLTWMIEHLEDDQPVRKLARQAAMSERTFARKFVAETGTTPARWLGRQRIHRARELLERSNLTIESVAARSGFGSAALLRHHFTRQVGVPPGDYRRTFSHAAS